MKATEYVVLTEAPTVHLVVLRYGDEPWLKVVAAFPNKDRADSYADVENQFIADAIIGEVWPDDETADAPAASEPASALPAVAARLKSVDVVALAPPQSEPVAAPVEPPRKIRASEPVEPRSGAGNAPAGAASEESPGTPSPPAAPQAAPDEAPEGSGSVEEIVAALWPNLSVPVGEIARRAGVSDQTVRNVRKRLGLPDRTALALDAYRAAHPRAQPAAPAVPDQPERDADEADEEADAPEAPAADTTHAVSAHGVTVVTAAGEECIAFGNETMDITDTQAKVLAILLKAAPNPVGVPFIVPRVWPRLAFLAGEERIGVIVRDLTKGLPTIGLELKSIKGVGLALGGFDT